MTINRFSLALLVPLSALGVASQGCEVSTCDAGEDCVDIDEDFWDEDAGPDAGDGDGDGDGDVDAGPDAGDGDGDGDGDALTVEQFCEAFFDRALAWRDKLTECCVSAPNTAESSMELQGILTLFGYSDTSVSTCIQRNQEAIDAGEITYDGTKAKACADARNTFFPEPPAACPGGQGFNYWELLGSVGHGAQALAQIPACREAFVGKIARDGECPENGHIQCAEGLRCREFSTAVFTCQDAVTMGNPCVGASDCVAGTICAGDPEVGKTCIAITDLVVAGGCGSDIECIEGNYCVPEDGGDPPHCAAVPVVLGDQGESCAEYECAGYCDLELDECAPLCAI